MRVEKTEYDNNRFEVTLREGVSWVISLDKLKELHELISAEISIHNHEYKQCEPIRLKVCSINEEGDY